MEWECVFRVRYVKPGKIIAAASPYGDENTRVSIKEKGPEAKLRGPF
jgi:hypothetical protein